MTEAHSATESSRRTISGACAVATPHVAATREAERVFRDGGNAVDAALAACAVLAVVYPHMSTLGGDIFALVRRPSGTVVGFNGSGAAPRCVDVQALRRRYKVMPVDGPDTVTVPGVVDAWQEMSRREGSLPLGDLLHAAIQHAREGCEVTSSLARAISEREAALRHDPGMSGVFVPRGRPLREGDVLVQPALADTLEALAESGAAAFYAGDLGRRFVRTLRERGCALSEDDLRSHATELATPLTARFREWTVLTMPPNSQGYTLAETLAVVDHLGLDLEPLGARAGTLAHVFRLVAEDRDRHLADPRIVDVPLDWLLGEGHMAAVAAAAVRSDREGKCVAAGDHRGPGDRTRPPSGDTIACVTADARGGAASVIQSIFHSFGSGIMDPSTGIIAQNRGACFSLDAQSPNVIAGGKRSLHTLMPVLVERGDRLAVVAGTMGGKAQPQIHAQVLGRIFRGLPAKEAVSSPRWVVGSLDAGGPADVVFAEPAALSRCGEALRSSGMEVQVLDDLAEDVGHAQYIRVESDGTLSAAADPRSDGAALTVT